MTRSFALWLAVILLYFGFTQYEADAHGGVVEEEDLCVIRISYLKAHLKIYQPLIDRHDEYCEDLPNATETIFVMEYMHDELARVPVEFRIIRDVTGKGRFARWEDVAAIGDLDRVTVHHQGPVVEPDVFTAIHDFREAGDYIGVVTAGTGADGPRRVAVFPFEVGYTGFGVWPAVVGVILLVQFQYLLLSGRISRWRARFSVTRPQSGPSQAATRSPIRSPTRSGVAAASRNTDDD